MKTLHKPNKINLVLILPFPPPSLFPGARILVPRPAGASLHRGTHHRPGPRRPQPSHQA